MMNRNFKAKQYTILWHVHDVKFLRVYSCIISSIISVFGVEYGNIEKMTITWGKIHKFLMMTINYSLPGKLKLSMVNYIGKMIDDIPEDMRGESAKSAAHHLFDIAEDATKLS